MGGPDRRHGEAHFGALEAVLRCGDHIALVELDGGTELFHALQVQIDRARADGAAAGQRHIRVAATGQQRAEHPEAGAHLRDEIIVRVRAGDGPGGEAQGAPAGLVGGVRPETRKPPGLLIGQGEAALDGGGQGFPGAAGIEHFDLDAEFRQQAGQGGDVGEARHVGEDQRLVGQEARDHQRQGGVLGAGNGNFPVKRVAAGKPDPVH